MSVTMMAWVWTLDLDHPKQSVMLALADHADDDGRNVFPSIAYVAWKTGYSERQVQRIMHDLKNDKLLIVERKARFDFPTVYRINRSAGKPKPAYVPPADPDEWEEVEGGDILTPPAENRGDILTPGGDKMTPGGDIAVSPEPSSETSNKPSYMGASALPQGVFKGMPPEMKKPVERKTKPVPKPVRPDKAEVPVSVKVYRTVRRAFPRRELWDQIAQTVGTDPEQLEFWRKVLIQYAGLGWNPNNVVGMLEWFERGELPHVGSAATRMARAPAEPEKRPIANREEVLARIAANRARAEQAHVV